MEASEVIKELELRARLAQTRIEQAAPGTIAHENAVTAFQCWTSAALLVASIGREVTR